MGDRESVKIAFPYPNCDSTHSYISTSWYVDLGRRMPSLSGVMWSRKYQSRKWRDTLVAISFHVVWGWYECTSKNRIFLGCHIGWQCLSILLYADDIIIIALLSVLNHSLGVCACILLLTCRCQTILKKCRIPFCNSD